MVSPAPVLSPCRAAHGEQACPLCGGENRCRLARGELYKGPCWCEAVPVLGPILKNFATNQLEPACFCPACLEAVSAIVKTTPDTEAALAQIKLLVRPQRPGS